MFKNFDSYDLFWILVGVGFMISFIICAFNISHDVSERGCVKFYIENRYITEDCERFANKLKEMKQKKE